jgi:broad specificity phosphatase PhoE
VNLAAPTLVTRDEFIGFVNDYEFAGLRQEAPPDFLVRHVRNASAVFVSPSLRARQSLQLLHPERNAEMNAVFSEEPLVIPQLPGRWPLFVWFILARGMGAFDPRQSDVRRNCHLRAQAAANCLVAAAQTGPVALIGHGWFNRTISKALRRQNWRRVDASGGISTGGASRNWGYVMFELSKL